MTTLKERSLPPCCHDLQLFTYNGCDRVKRRQNLWPRYDRHFVGITRRNMWCYVATIYRVIQMKFTKFADENVRI